MLALRCATLTHIPSLPFLLALQVKMKPGKPLTFAKVPVPEQNRWAAPSSAGSFC